MFLMLVFFFFFCIYILLANLFLSYTTILKLKVIGVLQFIWDMMNKWPWGNWSGGIIGPKRRSNFFFPHSLMSLDTVTN